MLDRARTLLPADDRIRWRQADAMALPFEDHSFDAVVCQFGVMFFPDKVAGHREARRVLRPGGHLMFSVWDRLSQNDFAQIATDALADIFPDDPVRFMARIPHGYFEPEPSSAAPKREAERIIAAGPIPFVILRPGFVVADAAYVHSAVVAIN